MATKTPTQKQATKSASKKAAVRAQERLFTSKPIFLGVEESLKHPDAPCGLATDAERARHVRQRVVEMLNSRGEWEKPGPTHDVPASEVKVFAAATRSERTTSSTTSHRRPARCRV